MARLRRGPSLASLGGFREEERGQRREKSGSGGGEETERGKLGLGLRLRLLGVLLWGVKQGGGAPVAVGAALLSTGVVEDDVTMGKRLGPWWAGPARPG